MTDGPSAHIPEPSPNLPLDPTLFNLTENETSFLRMVVSANDDELRERIMAIQKEAYAVYPYPCIRYFHFVAQAMADSPAYWEIVAAGRDGTTTFVDLGCHMGTDVRRLIHDGYAPSQVFACDLHSEFINLGYKLFRDEEKCPIRFFTANVFDIPHPSATFRDQESAMSRAEQLAQLKGRVNHIFTGLLFHLFDEKLQYELGLKLISLLNLEASCVIFGRQRGHANRQEGYIPGIMGSVRYAHSPQSWKRLWKQLFTEAINAEFAETRVIVEADLKMAPTIANGELTVLYWSVKILSGA